MLINVWFVYQKLERWCFIDFESVSLQLKCSNGCFILLNYLLFLWYKQISGEGLLMIKGKIMINVISILDIFGC